MLVGNKIDLPYRAVQNSEGKQVAESLRIGYWELSAKTGEKVEELFLHLVEMLAQNKVNGNVGGSTPTTPVGGERRAEWKEEKQYVRMAERLPDREGNQVEETQGVMMREYRDVDTIVKGPPQLYIPAPTLHPTT